MLGALLMAVPILGRAIEDLLHDQLRMTMLVALAVLASVAREDYATAGVISFFVLVSQAVERRTAMGAHKAIESIVRLVPNAVRLVTEQGEAEIPLSELKPGQKVRIRPGENVPADGIIRRGQSALNQATITGESLPVDKYEGDEVFAGTTNLTGSLDIEVTSIGPDTTLGKVRELILRAQTTKSTMMQIVEQHAQWYTPTILMIAGIILYFSRDMERAITAMVIACPGALVLATPTAMVAAISCAARLGILVKKAADLEFAGRLTAMIFDKTGTLTTGELGVTRLFPAKDVLPEDIVRLAASAERDSNHPTAQAIVRLAKQAGVRLADPSEFEESVGLGVRARVNGNEVRVGRRQWLESQGIDFSAAELTEADAGALSTIFVARDRRCIGWIGLEDRPRQEARQATEELKELGISRLVMLTGDRRPVAEKVAAELGCTEFEAECLPETKLKILERMRQENHLVSVIGDGVNDAPALAAADLGIAMGAAGNDIAMNSASIALMNNDLSRIPFLVRLSRRCRSVVNQNLLFGVLFIVVGLTLSAFGWLRPGVAAILYMLSSVFVVFNSARLVRFGEELAPHDAIDSAAASPNPAPATP
jgi:Cd2+/Zn2+-exporting ATPase